jgi:hypothetical protein
MAAANRGRSSMVDATLTFPYCVREFQACSDRRQAGTGSRNGVRYCLLPTSLARRGQRARPRSPLRWTDTSVAFRNAHAPLGRAENRQRLRVASAAKAPLCRPPLNAGAGISSRWPACMLVHRQPCHTPPDPIPWHER